MARAKQVAKTAAKQPAKKSTAGPKRASTKGDPPPSPLSKAAAKQALAHETAALRVLCKGAGREDWQIGKRLSQIAELGLHRAAGFTTIDDYAESELALARTKTFQFMRVAASFSEAMVAAHGMDKLEAVLAYFKATPEDDGPADVQGLQVRVPDAKGKVHKKRFDQVTVRELAAARKHEAGAKPPPKPKPEIQAHAHAAAAGLRAVRLVVGKSNAPRVALELTSADGIVTFELRGVPLSDGPRALRALAKALDGKK